jgi:ABC-2 type transport system permease protein
MRKLRAVATKELKQVLRDPLSLLTLIGFPAFMLLLYGFALNFDVRHVGLAIQDLDHTRASRDVISSFINSTYFDVAATPGPTDDLARLLERRVAKAVLVIPEGFASSLAAGRSAQVQLLLDGSDSLTATTVLGYADAIVAESNVRVLGQALTRAGQRLDVGIDFEPRVYYNPELRSVRFLVPGLVGLIMMLTGVLSTALSVVREKERGTIEQIRMAPLSGFELIVGKTLPYLGLSLVATAFILTMAWAIFGVEIRGSRLDLFAATLLYLLGALGFGLLISTLVNSQALAFQIGLLGSLLPALLLSGFVFQIRLMPVWLKAITYLVPARYYLVILRGIILKGASLAPYWDQMGLLALYTTVVLGLATVRMTRREG